MKKAGKSKSTLFVAMFVFAMVLCFCPSKKVAASQGVSIPKKSGKTICCMIADKDAEYNLFIEDVWKIPHGKNMTVVSFKSSNKKVLKAWIAKDEEGYSKIGGWPCVKLRKPGKAKVTLTYKSGGKVYKYVVNVQVIKYQNPIKVFKIGNKNYAYVYNKVNARGVAVDKNGMRMPVLKKGTYKYKLQTKKDFSIAKAENENRKNIKNAKKIKIGENPYFSFQIKYKGMVISNLYFQS